MRREILEKLKRFLTQDIPFKEECHVVYLLVEIRKVLDHAGDRKGHAKFPFLRFYADWSVHTDKSFNITPQIKQIMEHVHKGLLAHPDPSNSDLSQHPHLAMFFLSSSLRKEMMAFLQDHKLPDGFAATGSDWWKFAELLIGILSDQPLNEPCPGIQKFSFTNGRKMELQYKGKSGQIVTREFDGLA